MPVELKQQEARYMVEGDERMGRRWMWAGGGDRDAGNAGASMTRCGTVGCTRKPRSEFDL